jgi:KEOPS complex subunit Cgi121
MDVEVQFFDSKTVATWEHLYFAALNALTSFSNKTNISKTLTMETLLYAAAERQIIKATKKMGIKQTTSDVAALIIGKDKKKIESTISLISKMLKAQPDDEVFELTKSKCELIKKLFSISETELSSVKKGDDANRALVELVIERVALVSSKR